jgi:signal peptide peptidase SppA
VSRRDGKAGKNAIAALHAAHWAITPDSLEQMMAIASRALDEPITTIEALEAKLGKPVNADALMTLRDGVATINVTGPLFRYANIFTMISGATAYATLATDLQQALDSTQVRGIILVVDSPGGEVNGSAELANMIFDARGSKPIVAYISGMGASAAYWIASAADEVVVAPTALVGSIGAVIAVSDRTKADEARGVSTIEIVSSQSPKKRLSPTSAEGQSEIQLLVDNLAQVFIEALAKNRGVSADTVLADFGEGGLFVGAAAVDAGLADRVGSYEQLQAELAGGSYVMPEHAAPQTPQPTTETEDPAMKATANADSNTSPSTDPAAPPATDPAAPATDPAQPDPAAPPATDPAAPDASSDAVEVAARLERERISAISALGRPGEEKVIAECIADPKCTPAQAALKLRQAENVTGKGRLRSLAADDKNLEAPGPNGPAADAGSANAVARRIIAAHEKVTSPNRSK